MISRLHRGLIPALILLLFLSGSNVRRWGFFGHKKINELAVFTLPPDLIVFYKSHLQYVSENAVNPDRRRYAVEGEAPKHYVDLDVYGDSAAYKLPRYWKEAKELLTEDTLLAYGIVPWHINSMKYQLTEAFKIKDLKAILRLSADLGHYIGDANVPLHTTENYNGQLTGQYGIHGFWESRLPELFFGEYDFFVGRASYVENPQLAAWGAVIAAHEALDSVLTIEKNLSSQFREDKKYTYEERGTTLQRTYSRSYARAYHQALAGMVERRMRASVKMVGDFWYTCWVDAGQPNLRDLKVLELSQLELDSIKNLYQRWDSIPASKTLREHDH